MIIAGVLCVALSSLVSTIVAQSYQVSISNGTCYYSNDEKAENTYIPCGNDAAFGIISCCQVGDICLSSSACFNARYGVTYLAGCTDPTYKHDACPYKGEYYTQQWTGVVRCFVSNDSSLAEEEWAACEDKKQPTLAAPDKCKCDHKTNPPVFTDSPTLTNIAQLPLTTGGTLSWFPEFQYYSDSDESMNSLLSVTQSTMTHVNGDFTGSRTAESTTLSVTSYSPSEFPSSKTASSSSTPINSLSTGAKVGIGVGVAVFALAVLGLLSLLRFCRRRHRQQNVPAIKDQIRPYSGEGSFWVTDKDKPEQSSHATDHDSASFGYKFELPADTCTRFGMPSICSIASSQQQDRSVQRSPQTSHACQSLHVNDNSTGNLTRPKLVENVQSMYEFGNHRTNHNPSCQRERDTQSSSTLHSQLEGPTIKAAYRRTDDIFELPG